MPLTSGRNCSTAVIPHREELAIGVYSPVGLGALAGTIDIPGGASCVAVTNSGMGVVVGDLDDGEGSQLSSLSIVDPVLKDVIGFVDFTEEVGPQFDPFGVQISEDQQIAFGSGGFRSNAIVVIDISNPLNPEFITSVLTDPDNSVPAFGIALAKDFVFVSNPSVDPEINSALTLVNVADPAMAEVELAVDPLGVLVDVATKERENSIRVVTVNADFQEVIPGTPPGGISVFKVKIKE